MRGSPLIRAAIMVVALLTLLLPLHRLTSGRAEAAPSVAPAAANVSVHLALTSTAAPFRFQVSHLGKVIWRGESASPTAETDVAMPFPPEGVDLAVRADWSGGQTAAVRLAATIDGNEPIERTVWGDGSAEDVLTFK